MSVHAPFRFAPIHRWVHTPDWAQLVSHDVPFRDGLSGEITFDITAETHLLIGGARGQVEGEARDVRPYRLPDGRYAIPGSSLQGMVRSILEIATFGRLGPWIDDKRFGIRDLNPAARPFYQNRLNSTYGYAPINVDPQVKTGWLRRAGDGFYFTPCSMARIEYATLVSLTGVPVEPVPPRANRVAYRACRAWGKKSDVGERYGWFTTPATLTSVQPVSAPRRHDHSNHSLSILYAKVEAAGVAQPGTIVLTGNASDPGAGSRKHMEFFFYDNLPEQKLPATFGKVYAEFLDIHQPDDGRDQNPNWDYYNTHGHPATAPFKMGGMMPIFYISDSASSKPASPYDIGAFGLAFMFKLPHECSTHEVLKNSSAAHVEEDVGEEADIDLPTAMFGEAHRAAKDGRRERGLRRRAAFDMAVTSSQGPAPVPVCGSNATVMLAPKPNYFPIYVTQPTGAAPGELPRNGHGPEPYATYTPLMGWRPEHGKPTLAGVKIWPARRDERFPALPTPPPPTEGRPEIPLSVQTKLSALPVGTRFPATRLRFHNLKPQELGALLWALSFGDRKVLSGEKGVYWHRLGMGKAFGMGSVSICISSAELRPNDHKACDPSLTDVLVAFETYMAAAYAKAGGKGSWGSSEQVRALRKAANPDDQVDECFDYMRLDAKGESETYVGAKKAGHFMPPYLHTTAPSPLVLIPGARIRLSVGTQAEGELLGPHETQTGRWWVLLDGDAAKRHLSTTVFEVIAPPPAAG